MLKIRKISIEKYGKLENMEINLKDGLNVIYGDNESGKSTLQSFIRAIFFGMKNSREKGDRKRYMPWSGGVMSGSITLKTDAREIVLSRVFGKTARADSFSAFDNISGENLPFLTDETAGNNLLEMSENLFMKTVWIKQGDIAIGGSDDEITRRLVNLSISGDEEVSQKSAVKTLENAMLKIKMKDKRNSKGIVDLLQSRRNELIGETYKLNKQETELKKIRKLHSELNLKMEELSGEIDMFDKLRQRSAVIQQLRRAKQLKQCREKIEEMKEDEIYTRYHGMTDDISSDIETKHDNLNVRVNADSIKRAGNTIKLILIFVVCSLLGGIGMMLSIYSGLAMIAGLLGVAFSVWRLLRVKRQTQELESKLTALKDEFEKKLEEFGADSIEDFREKHRLYIRLDESIRLYQDQYDTLLDGEDFDLIINNADKVAENLSEEIGSNIPENIDAEIKDRQLRQIQLSEQIKEIELEIKLSEDCVSATDINTEIAGIDEQIAELEKKYNALSMAKSELELAAVQLSQSFGPILNSEAGRVIAHITQGRYNNIKVTKDYRIKLAGDSEIRDAESCSAGAYDQIYFALRLGLACVVCGNNAALFLDDTFAQFDDKRAKSALEYVKRLADSRQVILFTCHLREVKNAEEMGGINVMTLPQI